MPTDHNFLYPIIFILYLVETIVVYKFPDLEREVIATMLELYSMKETRVFNA